MNTVSERKDQLMLGRCLSQENSFSIHEYGHLEIKFKFTMSLMDLKSFSSICQQINY